jgi:hypothetical protein
MTACGNKIIENVRAEDNPYVAFLWPSLNHRVHDALAMFREVIAVQSIQLSARGAPNLIYELYNGAEWIGAESTGYHGVKQKVLECFPNLNPFFVVVFSRMKIEEVRELKKRIRALADLEFSSVHITDTKTEAIQIADLLFRDNGLHFINSSTPYRYANWEALLEEARFHSRRQHLDVSDVLIEGSAVMSLYGLRANRDIDIVSYSSFLAHSSKSYQGILADVESKILMLRGVRFLSLSALYQRKKKRAEIKFYWRAAFKLDKISVAVKSQTKLVVKKNTFIYKILRRVYDATLGRNSSR